MNAPFSMVSHTSQERSCFRITAINPTTPDASPHNIMKMLKKGSTVCRHGTFSGNRMNTKELMMDIAMNAAAKPTAHQPSRVPGRCRKVELE